MYNLLWTHIFRRELSSMIPLQNNIWIHQVFFGMMRIKLVLPCSTLNHVSSSGAYNTTLCMIILDLTCIAPPPYVDIKVNHNLWHFFCQINKTINSSSKWYTGYSGLIYYIKVRCSLWNMLEFASIRYYTWWLHKVLLGNFINLVKCRWWRWEWPNGGPEQNTSIESKLLQLSTTL